MRPAKAGGIVLLGWLAGPVAVHAATVIQPDIRVGPSYISVDRSSGGEDLSEGGGQVDARVRFAFVDEVSSIVFIPKIMQTLYSGNESLEREEQRATILWDRKYQTGNSSLRFDYSRQDLFSAELEDFNTDPDTDPGGSDSGLVGQGTRDRLFVAGDFAKQISQTGDLVFDVSYADIEYDEDGATSSRVDYSQLLLSAGYRHHFTDRTALSLTGGGRRYEGDNGVKVDSYRGDIRIDWTLSELSNAYVTAGYEQLSGSQGSADLDDSRIVPFTLGIEKRSERTQYGIEIGRYARPVSTGQFRDRLQAVIDMQYQLTQRMTLSLGIVANREEQLADTGLDSERDYYSGWIDLDWALGSRWSAGLEYNANQQDFSGLDAPSDFIDSRQEIFLSIRYRGLDRTSRAIEGR